MCGPIDSINRSWWSSEFAIINKSNAAVIQWRRPARHLIATRYHSGPIVASALSEHWLSLTGSVQPKPRAQRPWSCKVLQRDRLDSSAHGRKKGNPIPSLAPRQIFWALPFQRTKSTLNPLNAFDYGEEIQNQIEIQTETPIQA